MRIGVLVLVLALSIPGSASASDRCFGQAVVVVEDNRVECERTGPSSCRVAAVNGTTGPVADQGVACLPHLCRPIRAGQQAEIACEDRAVEGGRQRATTLEAQFGSGSDERVPAFHARARFVGLEDDAGGPPQGHCRVEYESFSGPGPASVEAGQECPYVFLVP